MTTLVETPVQVWQNTDTLLTFTVFQRSGKVLVPYDLTGSVLEFYQKARSDVADPGVPQYTSAGANPPITLAPSAYDSNGVAIVGNERNRCLVQTSRSNHSSEGNQWYHLDATKSGLRVVLFAGTFTIRDV